MTKSEIVERVCDRVGGFSKREAADLVDELFDLIKVELAAGNPVRIAGFGHFVPRDKAPRQGRNPRTGQAITIDARRVIAFKPASTLKAALNDE